MVQVWRPGDSFVQLVLFIHLYMGYRVWTQVTFCKPSSTQSHLTSIIILYAMILLYIINNTQKESQAK